MVNIYIRRFQYTKESIISTFKVTSTKAPAHFRGYALENSHAGKHHNKKPTPQGSYPAKIRTDGSKGWRIELLHVPGHTHIEIHVGNYPWDSEGCFLPGQTMANNVVWRSAEALQSIKSIVEKDGTGAIMVHVIGKNEKP